MEKKVLIERSKVYLELLSNGVHPVSGTQLPQDSVFIDEKIKKCFAYPRKGNNVKVR